MILQMEHVSVPQKPLFIKNFQQNENLAYALHFNDPIDLAAIALTWETSYG